MPGLSDAPSRPTRSGLGRVGPSFQAGMRYAATLAKSAALVRTEHPAGALIAVFRLTDITFLQPRSAF